jgi:hypothetical protein
MRIKVGYCGDHELSLMFSCYFFAILCVIHGIICDQFSRL